MLKHLTVVSLLAVLVIQSAAVDAQEVKVNKGFVFYAGSYSLDEQTYGLYEEGHAFRDVLKEVPAALSQFESYEFMHMTGNVLLGLGLVAAVVGGVAVMPGVKEEVPESLALIGFAGGAGLAVAAVVFEFVSWSSLSGAVDTYNKEMDVDDGPAFNFSAPLPMLALTENAGFLSLGWRF